ncbi:sigma factor G inhibitor Gin [Heliorestis convoluta]|nr:sigma factor G inhibitor Gin [Heliorestis convoluta]
MTATSLRPRCAACQETPEGGLHDGLWVKGLFICSRCCETLPHWLGDEVEYARLKESLKCSWRGNPDWRKYLAIAENP